MNFNDVQNLEIDFRKHYRTKSDSETTSEMDCFILAPFCLENQAHDTPKTPQDAQGRPGRLQKPSRLPYDTPKTAQDAPRHPRTAPRRPQKGPKTLQHTRPGRPKPRPRRPMGSSWDLLRSFRTRLSACPSRFSAHFRCYIFKEL